MEIVPDLYVRAVWEAGGLPVMLPVLPDAAEQVLDRVDGVVLTGGGDISPALYGESAHDAVHDVDADRDAMECALVRRAIDQGRPLLAICRGAQVLNVALGGTLILDLPTDGWADHHQKVGGDVPTHSVEVSVDSRLHQSTGREVLSVNSFHHQAIATPASALKPVAWTVDGLVEAVELRAGHPWVLGVQWHPEMLAATDPAHARLFAALAEWSGDGGGVQPRASS